MAVLAIVHGPQFTRQQYDTLRPKVRWEQDYPHGALLHACAFDDTGGLRVVDLWESPEQLENFFQTRLLPVLQEMQVEPPTVQVFPVHNIDAFPGIAQHTP